MAEVEAPAAALPAALDEGPSILDVPVPAAAAATAVEQVPQAILNNGQQEATAGQLKASTPPLSKQPSALSSKLNSLKERRSQQPPVPAAGLISAAPAESISAEAPVLAATPAAPGQVSSQDSATAVKSPSKVPTGALATATGPSPHSKIPTTSPQRPARGVSSVEKDTGSTDPATGSPAHGAVWSTYNRMQARARSSPTVTGPTDEEKAKRRQWALEKRKKEELRLRADSEKRSQQETRQREDKEARLEACRARVRERIAKQHELQAKLTSERAAAEAKARHGVSRFKGKPLHEKLQEDYERVRQAEEEAKRAAYEEEARTKHVRPRQIITGEVVVKPSQSPMRQRDASPGRHTSTGKQRPAIAGAPFSAGRHSVPGAVVADDLHEDIPEEIVSPTAEARKERVQKPRKQGVMLYSTRQKAAQQTPSPVLAPRLVERAASPFIFDSHAMPTNVPDQMQFWSSHAAKLAIIAMDGDQRKPTEGTPEATIDQNAPTEAYAEDFEPSGEEQANASPAVTEASAVEDVTATTASPSKPEKPEEEGMEATFALAENEQLEVSGQDDAAESAANTSVPNAMLVEPATQEQTAVTEPTGNAPAIEPSAEVVTTSEQPSVQAEDVSVPAEVLSTAMPADAEAVVAAATAEVPVREGIMSEPLQETSPEQQQAAIEPEQEPAPAAAAVKVNAEEVITAIEKSLAAAQNTLPEEPVAETTAEVPGAEQAGGEQAVGAEGLASVEEKEVAALPENEAVSTVATPAAAEVPVSGEAEGLATEATPDAEAEPEIPPGEESKKTAAVTAENTTMETNETAAVETTATQEVVAVSEPSAEPAQQEGQSSTAEEAAADEQQAAAVPDEAPVEPAAE